MSQPNATRMSERMTVGEIAQVRANWKVDGSCRCEMCRLLAELAAVTRERAKDTERLDWLAQFVTLGGETRTPASDGLPAAMEWDWDSFDGGSLRESIDATIAMEAARVSA